MLKNIFVLLISIFMLPVCIAAESISPENLNLPLDQNNSNIGFAFQSPFIAANGSFTSFSGSLGVDKTKKLIKSVIMNIDVARFQLANPTSANFLALTALANSLPGSQFKFASTSVSYLSEGRLKVLGTLSGAGKQKPAVFYATQRETASGEIAFKADVSSKDFNIDWPKEIAAFGAESISGKLNLNLFF